MATATSELILRFSGDISQLRQAMAQARAEIGNFSQGQASGVRNLANATQQAEQRRVAETIRSANQRLREEQRAAREVARITAETARQAAAQERIRERAAKQLADVRIREAKRSARELEKSLASGRRSGGSGFDLSGLTSITGQVPALGGLTSQLNAITSASGSAGAATASLAGPIGIAVAAFLAEAAAVAALANGLFDLTKQTADFQGKLFDMSQQVGVSVETLSGLEILATTTGGNIETVAASLAIFQRHLESAHDPTSKEADLLRDLGVTSSETEEALRQTIRGLFALGEGSKQTDAALRLFGRSGRFVNAILKESAGDLDGAIKKFREMGLIVSTDAAKAADEFNDTMATLDFQMRALKATIGQQVMPTILSSLKDLQQFLKDNKEAIEALGIAAKGAGILLIAPFKAAIVALNIVLLTHKHEIKTLISLYEQLAALMQLIARGMPKVDINAIPPQINIPGALDGVKMLQDLQELWLKSQIPRDLKDFFGKEGKTGAGRASADRSAERAARDIALQQQEIEEATRAHRENLERERQKDLQSIEDWKNAAIDIESERLAGQQRTLDKERANARLFIKNKEDLALELREIDQKDQKAQNEFLSAVTKIRDEAIKRREQQDLDTRRQLLDLGDAFRDVERDKIKADLEDGIISLSGAKQRELALLTQAQKERIALIDFELQQQSTSTARKIELDIQKQTSEASYTKELKRLTRERIDALVEEGAAATEGPAGGRRVPEGDFVPIDIGPPPEITLWEEALIRLRGVMQSFSDFARSTFVGAFEGIAGAIAQGVEAWALYGDSIGEAMRRGLAAVAARIAGEAMFMGALHAAYAIGSLALLDFRGAAQHAIAAAKFFAVAAIAGVGARAIAGNVSRSSGGGSASSGSRAAASDRDRERSPIDLTRPQLQERLIILRVESNDSHILKVIQQDVRGNGPTRDMIINTAGG